MSDNNLAVNHHRRLLIVSDAASTCHAHNYFFFLGEDFLGPSAPIFFAAFIATLGAFAFPVILQPPEELISLFEVRYVL
jgi:hypothetical protein